MIDPANKRGTKTTKETKFFLAGDGGSTLCFQLRKTKNETSSIFYLSIIPEVEATVG